MLLFRTFGGTGLILCSFLWLWSRCCLALHLEEAGELDFLVATSGHGTTRFAHRAKTVLITSDSPVHSDALGDATTTTSCRVAGRDVATGRLLWRRLVCAKQLPQQQQHVVTALSERFYTLDQTGIVRAWVASRGALIWDTSVLSSTTSPPPADGSTTPRLWLQPDLLVAVLGPSLSVLDTRSGRILGSINLDEVNTATLAANADWKPPTPEASIQWIDVISPPPSSSDTEKPGLLRLVFGYLEPQQHGRNWIGHDAKTAVLEVQASPDGLIVPNAAATVRSDGSPAMADTTRDADDAASTEFRQLLSSSSSDGSNVDDATLLAQTHCAAFDNLVVGIQRLPTQQSSSPWRAWQITSSKLIDVPISGDVTPSNTLSSTWLDGDTVQDLITLACSPNSTSVLLSTTGGTTRVVTFTKAGNVIHSNIRWTAEEGLSTISSAIMLDASHIVLADDDSKKKNDPSLLFTKLDLASRLEFQYKLLKSMVLSSPTDILGGNQNGRRRYRQQAFGFVKIAVLLSKSAHRVWGMGTTDPHRGELVWTLPLPTQAKWHSLVHGKASAAVGVNGINGGTHSRDVLILSNVIDSMQWHCFDGTTGVVHQQGSVALPVSPVVQVVPLLAAAATVSGGKGPACRQMALLLHQDRSMTLVPQDSHEDGGLSPGVLAVREIESSTKLGLYTHVVDPQEQQAKVESFRIHVTESGSFQSSLVGQTLFPGEDVVGLAYPIRDEIVQSPTMVLGDDSLLVKYLNPHMAVVVTFASNVSKPLLLPNKGTKSKRKPLGVTPPTGKQQQADDADAAAAAAAASTLNQDPANLFVNVVDTVSGRVLHRASHSNAARPLQPNIPMLINENWVYYSFVNEKTRRTEVGVMSLYEGMIDRNGITAFSSPEQTLAFSSLDARESKPVVLAKSFALTKQVTALGVTVTRTGISTPHILIACGDDKIYAVDRRMLDPRRPVGELKESEKLEGLQQYVFVSCEPLLVVLAPHLTFSCLSLVASDTVNCYRFLRCKP